jgi:hypothetical protein
VILFAQYFVSDVYSPALYKLSHEALTYSRNNFFLSQKLKSRVSVIHLKPVLDIAWFQSLQGSSTQSGSPLALIFLVNSTCTFQVSTVSNLDTDYATSGLTVTGLVKVPGSNIVTIQGQDKLGFFLGE